MGVDVTTSDHGQRLGLDTEYPISEGTLTCLHESGWARLPQLLSGAVVEEIRAHLAAGRLRDSQPGPEKKADKNPNVSYEGMAWRDRFLHDVATSRRVGGTVVRLMRQPTAAFVQDISFNKPAHSRPTPLHQDFSYFPFDRKGILSVWIALVDMTEDMGPLHYLEGSHHEGPLGYMNRDRSVDIRDTYPQLRDRAIVAGEPLAAGDAQVHWGLTVHGAGSNDTDTARESWVARYVRSDAVYTGLRHPHYDRFELETGSVVGDCDVFPTVAPDGLIGR